MRLRFFLAFSIIILITLAGVEFFVRSIAAQEVRTFINRGGALGIADVVTELEDYYQSNGSWEGAWEVLARAASPPGQGRARQDGSAGGPGLELRRNLQLSDAAGNLILAPSSQETAQRVDPEALASGIQLIVDGATVGYLVLPAGFSSPGTEMESVLLERLNRASLNVAIIGGALALLLAFLFASYLLRPIQALILASRQMSQGDLSQRVRLKGGGEIAELGHTFNQMAESLEQMEARRKELTADIAHELRNPLAIQRANLEALQDGIFELTPEHLDPILEQNKLLTRLVADLRTLALSDAGELQLQCQPIDMIQMIATVVDRFQDHAAQRNITLQTDFPTSCPPVEADSQRIEQVLVNLLDNALRHSPEGGLIILAASCTATYLKITVRDTGPGIPENAIPHIFERFYRVDRARSRDQGGTGLGLAIARNLIENHHGKLTAENHPEGGAIFTIQIPFSQS